MTRFLTLGEVLEIHRLVVEQAGGAAAVRDLAVLEASVGQPRASWGGVDLYPSIEEKAAALCFGIVMGHPFTDGNKRTGHAALEIMLDLNGVALVATVDAAEATMLRLAAGELSRAELVDWVKAHAIKK